MTAEDCHKSVKEVLVLWWKRNFLTHGILEHINENRFFSTDRDPSVCLSVCPSTRRTAALGYRHAGCLQLSHVRTADASADERRSAASGNAGGDTSSRRSRRDNLFFDDCGDMANWKMYGVLASRFAVSTVVNRVGDGLEESREVSVTVATDCIASAAQTDPSYSPVSAIPI